MQACLGLFHGACLPGAFVLCIMSAMPQRAVVVGIDEAGYGPILGPLVVSAAAFEVPAPLVDASLWEVLNESVANTPRPRDRRLPILDSKRLYHRREGLAALERSALAAVTAWRGLPKNAAALFQLLCPDVLRAMPAYPWYRNMTVSLPLAADTGGLRLAASRLKNNATNRSVALAGLFCEPLLEEHYNRMVAATRNKALVLFALTTRLLQRVADAFPGRPLHIFIDRHGARSRYGRMLMQSFMDRRLVILEETDTASAYELRSDAAPWRIRFSQNGESRHLPVALASIISKYVRELFMHGFNDYWQVQVPGLTGTAGYYTDGCRFLDAIRPHLPRLGIGVDRLVRRQ
jgi:hypothetical protein